MTVQLQASVKVDNAGAVAPLQQTAAATKGVSDAMKTTAADAKAAGAAVAAEAKRMADAQKAEAKSVASAIAGEAKAKAAAEKAAAKEAAAVVIAEAKRKEAAERAAIMAVANAIRGFGRQQALEAKEAADAVVLQAKRKQAAEEAAARASAAAVQKTANLSRIGTAQLGMQLNDMAVMASMGAKPLQIFASQANQVGMALGMMGGAAGKVGAFFMGPWGAAVTVGAAVLTMLIGKAGEAGDAGTTMADRYGEAGQRIQDSFITPVKEAALAVADLVTSALGNLVDNTVKELDWAAQRVDEFADFVQRTNGLIPRMLSGGQAMGDSQLDAVRKRQAAAVESRRRDAALKADLASENATFGFDPKKPEEFGKAFGRAAAEAAREAKRLAATAKSEAKQAADAAIREAKRVAAEQAKFVAGMVQVAREAASTDLFKVGMVDAQFAPKAGGGGSGLKGDSLGDLIGKRDDVRANEQELKQLYRDLADEQMDQLLSRADDLGYRIGGTAGGVLQDAVGALHGARTGDFRGVGGAAGGVLQYGADTFGKSDFFKQQIAAPIVNKLQEIFPNANFAKELSENLQAFGFGASVGTMIGGNNAGSQIGGALGSVAGKALGESIGGTLGKTLGSAAGPLGSMLGSIAGSLLGGLFSSAKTGSATVNIANGEAAVTGQSGNNESLRRATTTTANAVISSIGDIAAALGGDLGNAKVSVSAKNDKYYVDYAGAGRTKKVNGQVIETKSAEEALALAMANAIKDGAVTNVSARVQAALHKYADDLNRAAAEAIKIQGIEKLLADQKNPFASVFIDFEKQMKERLRVAKDYGFNLVEIEKINAQERAKLLKETMASATGSIKELLDDLRFGSRAEGSATERLAGLGSEQARIRARIDGGATDQNDALASVIQQTIDLSKSAYGTTGRFVDDRAGGVSTLEAVLAQTEARIKAASEAAQSGKALAELNTTADEQLTTQQQMLGKLDQIYTGIKSGGGINFDASLYDRVQLV